jgi:uncharacterized protein YjiS (DUF1127 family)
MAYAHDTQRTSIAQGSLWQRLNDLRADLVERLAKYRLYRATLNELGSLTDRDLNDLGLHRAMIESVARQAAYRG